MFFVMSSLRSLLYELESSRPPFILEMDVCASPTKREARGGLVWVELSRILSSGNGSDPILLLIPEHGIEISIIASRSFLFPPVDTV